MNLIAGFECGLLPWNQNDLLVTTGHTPEQQMREHYEWARRQGFTRARDGLVPGHDPVERAKTAPMDFDVIWDMVHYHWPDDPHAHALSVAHALSDHRSGCGDGLLPVNEPSCVVVHGRTVDDAVDLGIEMMRVAEDHCSVPFVTCDPMHDLHDETFHATDRLVATDKISAVGINYYPHHAGVGLSDLIRHVSNRYGLPVFVAETGWHEGHPESAARFPHIRGRHDWLNHVRSEVRAADVSGFMGVCWYPFLDVPPWDEPTSQERWPAGWLDAA